MKYAIASDIHGSAFWCERLLESIDSEGVDKLILLGDLLYHGPRNSLSDGYNSTEVAYMLNQYADKITAVRGNCDSEVDQTLLDFPCMADYTVVVDNGVQLFCTHGHLYLKGVTEGAPEGSIVFSGHTHVKKDETLDGVRYLNPGSVGIPRDDSHSYLIYEDGNVTFKILQ